MISPVFRSIGRRVWMLLPQTSSRSTAPRRSVVAVPHVPTAPRPQKPHGTSLCDRRRDMPPWSRCVSSRRRRGGKRITTSERRSRAPCPRASEWLDCASRGMWAKPEPTCSTWRRRRPSTCCAWMRGWRSDRWRRRGARALPRWHQPRYGNDFARGSSSVLSIH
jgi:hypothetical protein